MDYNVRYNIDINGAQASKSISDFQNTIQKTIPPIISSLETLRKELGKINSAFVNFNRIIGTKPKKIKYTIDGSIKKELKSLQSQINAIKRENCHHQHKNQSNDQHHDRINNLYPERE